MRKQVSRDISMPYVEATVWGWARRELITRRLFVQNKNIVPFILTKAGISLHWVPEVFSRVRRGASDTAHEKPLAPRVAFHTSFLVFPQKEQTNNNYKTITAKNKQTNKNKQTKHFPNVDVQAPRFPGVGLQIGSILDKTWFTIYRPTFYREDVALPL